MTREEADEIWRTKVDDAPAIRLAEDLLAACKATAGKGEERGVNAEFRAKAGRVRGARVAVVINS